MTTELQEFIEICDCDIIQDAIEGDINLYDKEYCASHKERVAFTDAGYSCPITTVSGTGELHRYICLPTIDQLISMVKDDRESSDYRGLRDFMEWWFDNQKLSLRCALAIYYKEIKNGK